MLSPEQIALMTWLEQQSEPKSMMQMEAAKAPGYTSDRLEEMRTQGLLKRGMGFDLHGRHFGIYEVSDKGKAALLEIEQKRNQQAEEERRYEIQRQQADLQNALSAKQTKLALIQTIIAVVSFVTGLFCEHYIGLLDLLLRWFG